ncbi:THAP domain-containing protein 1-like [Colletes gigas]|uniref:THAP domain-containing protein 1-like n=1 Tax=Colletes gigas TaxID=935657 RepID=UPI001C9B199A|nr:THAP domain-containing protein 1-like [Colletes gigas]XP_043262261.1 THAP domain-containing protein 1-like [Colletes gigas]
MVRCEICKREKPVQGVSLHKFPKDSNELHQWLANIGRKDYMPKAGSVLCSRHFAPKCLEQKFNHVRLKKGSLPTLFMEENCTSGVDEPLSDENVIEAASSSEVIVESYDFHNPTESFQIHIPETMSEDDITHRCKGGSAIETNSESHTIHNRTENIIRSDHNYSQTPQTYKRKIRFIHETLHNTCKSNKVLKQKVKRLQKTVSSLRDVLKKLETKLSGHIDSSLF